MKNWTLLLLISIGVLGCNKDKSYSKKLMRGDVWRVDEITVDGADYGFLGQWNVTDKMNIYDSVPSVIWGHENEVSNFSWQFREKGKIFQIAAEIDSNCINSSHSDLVFQIFYLSGNYEVLKHRKKEMHFTSTRTNGFYGKVVDIKITKI